MSGELVETMAQLRELSPGAIPCLTLLGYHSRGDGGGGLFFWDADFMGDLAKWPDGEDGGTVIRPNDVLPGAPGRWRRLFDGPLSVKWFGARGYVGDGWDDQAAIQAACTAVAVAGGGEVVMPSGTYRTCSTVTLREFGVRLRGFGSGVGAFGNMGSVILYEGSEYALVIGDRVNDVQYGFSVANLTIVGTPLAKAGIRVGAILPDIDPEETNQLRQIAIREVCVTGFTNAMAQHDVSPGEYPVTGGCGVFLHRGLHGVLDHCDLRANFIGLLEASNGTVTTWQLATSYFQLNATCGIQLTDSVSVGLYNCIFEGNGAEGVYANTAGSPKSLMSLYMRDCYFEDNCRGVSTWELQPPREPTFDCHLVGKIYRATLESLNVNVRRSKGAVKIEGGAGCIVANVLVHNPDVSCVTTEASSGANLVMGLRAGSELLNNGTYSLDASTAFGDYIEGVLRVLTLRASEAIQLPNNSYLQCGDADGSYRAVLGVDPGNNVQYRAPAAESEHVFYTADGILTRARMQTEEFAYIGGARFAASSRGMRPPQVTREERDAMPLDALTDGVIIYQTDLEPGLRVYFSGVWHRVNVTQEG